MNILTKKDSFTQTAIYLIMNNLEQKGDLVIVVFTNPIYIQKINLTFFILLLYIYSLRIIESLNQIFRLTHCK